MIIRTSHNKDNPYVILNKKTLEIPELSLKAKGLWAYLISKPDNWSVNIQHLKNKLKEGEKAIYSTIKELQRYGLCNFVQTKLSNGQWDKGEYHVYEEPKLKKCLPDSQNRHAVKGDAATAPLLSTEEEISKERNNNTQDVAAASLEYFLSLRLNSEEIKRALAFKDKLSPTQLKKIQSLPAYLISVIQENYDREPDIPKEASPIKKNIDLAQNIENLLILNSSQLKVFACKEYLEFINGPWNETIKTDQSHHGFKKQLKDLLKKLNLLPEVENKLRSLE